VVNLRAYDGLTILHRLKLRSVWEMEVRSLGPDVWYRFSEPGGGSTLIDSSVNSRHGTYSGGPAFQEVGPVAGDSDLAVVFDGVDDYATLPVETRLSGTGAFSLVFLFRFDGSGSGTWMLFSQRDAGSGLGEILIDVQSAFSPARSLRVLSNGSNAATEIRVFSDAAVDAGTWHLGVYTQDASGNGELYLDGVSNDTDSDANWGVTPKTQEIGRDPSDGTDHWDGAISEFLIVDGTALSSAQVTALNDAWATPWLANSTSTRIHNILDEVGWPAATLRDIDTGLSDMRSFEAAGITALDAIIQAVETEDGQCWIDGAGNFVFRNRHARSTSTIDDTYSDDGVDVKLHDWEFGRDDLDLFTVAQVTDADGQVAEHVNATGEARYGPRVISRTSMTDTPTEPGDYAAWLAARFGVSRSRIERLNVRAFPDSDNTRWAAMLSRGLGDQVNVEINPKGGGVAIDDNWFVEQIILTGYAGHYEMTMQLSPAEGQQVFIIDDPVLGRLDGPGRIGW